MRIWFDALTAKQARIASILYLEGQRQGIDVEVTCRGYDYVENIFKLYGVPHKCVGLHGSDPLDKLRKGFERSLLLLNELGDFDVHVSLTSPDAFRIAFGLNKPIIAITDTLHSFFVNKLTLPLASLIILPNALPHNDVLKYVPCDERSSLRWFNGLFEVMWINRFTPNLDEIKKLNLEPDNYAVFRFEESLASYYSYGDKLDIGIKAIEELVRRGFRVIAFPRYPHQAEAIRSRFGDAIIIPETPLDGLNLAYHAALVITGGSTFSTEAALLGTPSISYFSSTYYIDDYLIKQGFPLYRCKPSELINCLSSIDLTKRRQAITGLVDPTSIILESARSFSHS